MRKYLLSVVVLIVISVIGGCSGGKPLNMEQAETNMVRLKIYRSVKFRKDPYLLILAREIEFYEEKRVITIKGLVNISSSQTVSGYHGYHDWVVPEIRVQDNILIINIPKDAPYTVCIADIGKGRLYNGYYGDSYYLPLVK